jgi:hypothetical protein
MACIARRLDRDTRQVKRGPFLVLKVKGFDGLYDPRVEIGEDIHWICSGL